MNRSNEYPYGYPTEVEISMKMREILNRDYPEDDDEGYPECFLCERAGTTCPMHVDHG